MAFDFWRKKKRQQGEKEREGDKQRRQEGAVPGGAGRDEPEPGSAWGGEAPAAVAAPANNGNAGYVSRVEPGPPPATETSLGAEAKPEPAGRLDASGEEAPRQGGFFARLKEGLAKTRQGLVGRLEEVLGAHKGLDEEFFEDLEAVLLQADVGVKATLQIIAALRERIKNEKIKEAATVKALLQEELVRLLETEESERVRGGVISGLREAQEGPTVWLVVGVNGAGKTTTIGKLAARARAAGKRVLLAAGDTFRAAAIEQLEVWAERAGAELIRHQEGSDPAAVVFDALQAARSRRADLVIVDTAGRLQTKVNLMEELKKIRRVIQRELPEAPQEVLLVLDATTGQNALSQAKLFHEVVELSGVILTKLDGTAKGGMVIALKQELGLPVKLIGIGEGVEDLREFVPADFVAALFA